MNDDTLETTIKKILEDKMAASAMDINVESKNGNIHLSGMVDTLGEKVSAEKIVKTLDDVRAVENNMTIATDGYIPDSDIEAYVQIRLKNSKDLLGVTPEVQGGSVTLIGRVKNRADEKSAIELAQQAMGVKTVASRIKIESVDDYDDDQVSSQITRAFINNGIDHKDVDHRVRENTVTLKGFVENRYELELAEELVSHIEGVDKIKNYLRTRD